MVAIWGCGNGRGKRSKSTTDQTVPFCRIKLSFSRESDHDSVTDESSIQSISFNVRYFKLKWLKMVAFVQMKTQNK